MSRTGRKRKKWVKISVAVLTTSLLSLGNGVCCEDFGTATTEIKPARCVNASRTGEYRSQMSTAYLKKQRYGLR